MTDPTGGPAVVRCPACKKDRWRGIGPCGNCGASPAPVPGPDTPTWTIDDYDDPPFRLAFNARPAVTGMPWCDDLIIRNPTPVERQARIGPEAFDALVADVRAARAHEHCGPATDTLRQARELARTVVEGRKGGFSTRAFADKAELALLDLLVDGGGDG